MCGVVAAAGIMAATTLASGFMAKRQADAQAKAYRQNAQYEREAAKQQNKQINISHQLRAEDRRERMQRAMAEQRTKLSASGVQSTGSLGLALVGDTAGAFEREQYMDDFNTRTEQNNTTLRGDMAAQSNLNKATSAKNQGNAALTGSFFDAAGSATSTYIMETD